MYQFQIFLECLLKATRDFIKKRIHFKDTYVYKFVVLIIFIFNEIQNFSFYIQKFTLYMARTDDVDN